jgi:DNA-binding NarL/FixJ family response regulator
MATVRVAEKPSVSPVRILVVEDNESFRQFIRSLLGMRAELQIVAEATDGLEAVRKAQELQPDLILLDVGLPHLDGFEAARRICKLALKSKIIFLSQESSSDIVRCALSLGAKGYVAKANAASDLLTAVNAIVQGKMFVSPGLTDQRFTDTE